MGGNQYGPSDGGGDGYGPSDAGGKGHGWPKEDECMDTVKGYTPIFGGVDTPDPFVYGGSGGVVGGVAYA